MRRPPEEVRHFHHLPNPLCRKCGGEGFRGATRATIGHACNCVFRSVFRGTLEKYKHAAAATGTLLVSAARGSFTLSMPHVEFMADFESAVEQCGLGSIECMVLHYHYIRGLRWQECLESIRNRHGRALDRGGFFHAAYRVELILGRHFYDQGIWPPLYFQQTDTSHPVPARLLRTVRHTAERWADPWLNGGYYDPDNEPAPPPTKRSGILFGKGLAGYAADPAFHATPQV